MGYFEQKADWWDDFFKTHTYGQNVNYDPRTKQFHQRHPYNKRSPELEIIESVSYKPFEAFQLRSPQTNEIKKMMVSSFLFNIYLKDARMFWFIIDNFRYFKKLYERGEYHAIFSNLKSYSKFYAGR